MGNSIFNQYIEKRNVITKNKKVLQTTYVPNVLPHRVEQIDSIASIISIALNGEKPSNIMVYGKTGTGKTAVVNYIGKELKKADESEEMKEVEDGALGKSQRWNKTSSWRLTKGCLVTRFLNCKFTMVVVAGGVVRSH